MDTLIGAYDEPAELSHWLALSFFPKTFPVQWRQVSITADLFASYMRSVPGCDNENMRHSIAYVLNELIENVIKFAAGDEVTVRCGVHEESLVAQLSNQVPFDAVEGIKATLEELVSDDPFELMVMRVEANAESEEDEGSGLGFLTMMTDYQVEFGWRIAPDAANPGLMVLHTLARLPIEE